MKLRAVFILGALVVQASVAHAGAAAPLSGFALTTWTQTDGPFAGDAWAIAQDRHGYLWFGTPSGLARFDGVRFVPWQGTPELPRTRVSALCAARDGSLWLGFGLRDGISRIENARVTTYTRTDGLTIGYVVSLIEDRQGTIWAAGHAGVARFRSGHWQQVGMADGMPAAPAQSLFESRNGDLWVGTARGVFRKTADGRFGLVTTAITNINAFAEDAQGRMWITDPSAALRLLDSSPPNNRERKTGGGTSLVYDRVGNLWVGTVGQGLLRVRSDVSATGSKGARFPGTLASVSETTVEQISASDGLPSAYVRSVLEDRDGNIWFGMQGGLGRLSQSSFSTVVGGRRLDGERVLSVVASADGAVWLASVNGLERYANGVWKRFGRLEGLDARSVSALHAAEDGTLWIATDQGPLHYVAGRFVRLTTSDEARLDRTVAITTDKDGGVWFCDIRRGVFRWKDGSLKPLIPRTETIGFSATTDRHGRVWIGLADGGLLAYQDGTIRSFSASDGLVGGTVNAIYEDRNGAIWIGTTQGLSRFRDERLVTVSGIASLGTGVMSIVDDDQGYLWLGVFSGVLRVEPSEFDRAIGSSHGLKYARFDATDGLRASPRRQVAPSASRDAQGMLWFLTERGAVMADPRKLRINQRVPTANIDAITADDRTGDPVGGQMFGPLTSRIQIDYTAPALGGSNKVQFRYKLEGFDPDWVDAGTRRQAFYTNLRPKHYRFRVMAGNNGSWSDSAASWDFVVRPAFYQTTWFPILCVSALAACVLSAWRLRIRHVKARYSIVLAERTRVSRDLHDTLLQGLFGLCLQMDAILTQFDSSPETAKARLHKARDYMELYIKETRHSIWGLRSLSIDDSDFVAALRRAADTLVIASGVALKLDVRGKPRRCGPDVEEQLLRIGQEAISNAVRHANATEIHVGVTYEKTLFKLSVQDNGRGISQVDTQDLLFGGLTSMRERAEKIGANLTLTSHMNRGTELELVLDIS